MGKIYDLDALKSQKDGPSLRNVVQKDFRNIQQSTDRILCSHILIPPNGGQIIEYHPISLGNIIYLPEGIFGGRFIPVHATYDGLDRSTVEGLGYLDSVYISHVSDMTAEEAKLFGHKTVEEFLATLTHNARYKNPKISSTYEGSDILTAAHLKEVVPLDKVLAYIGKQL